MVITTTANDLVMWGARASGALVLTWFSVSAQVGPVLGPECLNCYPICGTAFCFTLHLPNSVICDPCRGGILQKRNLKSAISSGWLKSWGVHHLDNLIDVIFPPNELRQIHLVSGWHILCHRDEIADFKFSQCAMALQRFWMNITVENVAAHSRSGNVAGYSNPGHTASVSLDCIEGIMNICMWYKVRSCARSCVVWVSSATCRSVDIPLI